MPWITASGKGALAFFLSIVLLHLELAAAQTLVPAKTYTTTYTVAAGTSWYLSGNYTFTTLRIQGKVKCGLATTDTGAINIRATYIEVSTTGTFECGTRAAPYLGPVTITMTGSGAEGTKVVDVSGTIRLHGKPRASWTSINTTIRATIDNPTGSSTFTTATPVDWQAGERIVVSSTDYDWKSAEERVIASVAPSPRGGSIVTVDTPFDKIHYGELQTFSNSQGRSWTLDERAQVALLDRNIVFQGDGFETAGIGAIITIRNGGNGYAMNTKFTRVGQLGRLGTYPWHWHMLGNRQGNYFINNVVTKSGNRCVTIHGTDNVLVERNVCYDNVGHGYFIEDGCEEGNVLKYNLGLSTKKPSSQAAGPIDTDTTHLSTFWITNPNNTFIGNVAAGSEFAGYWFMLPVAPTRECSTKNVKPGLQPNKLPLGTFDHNIAHSGKVGVAFEGGIKNTDRAPTSGSQDFWDPPVYPTMTNLTIYKNTESTRALWVTLFAPIYFANTKLADNAGSTLFSGAQVLENSILVGASANVFPSYRGSTVVGFGVYDGPAAMVNTHFTGFSKWWEYPIIITGAATKNWPFYAENVTFDAATTKRIVSRANTNFSDPEFFNTGLIDKTGSITGVVNKIFVLKLNATGITAPAKQSPDFNIPPGKCTVAPAGFDGYMCDPAVNWATVVIVHRFSPTQRGRVDVIRSDGKSASIDSRSRTHYHYNQIIAPAGIGYTIKYLDRNSLTWNTATGWPNPFEILLRNVRVGEAVKLTFTGLPTGPWMYSAARCYVRPSLTLTAPTKAGTFSMTMVAHNALVLRPAGKYPNLRLGYIRVKVCVTADGVCKC